MNGKIPPQARDIETAILGALMIDSNCLTIGMSKLFPNIFYKTEHQHIFSAIEKIYDLGRPIDILTVTEQLKKRPNPGGVRWCLLYFKTNKRCCFRC